MAMIGALGFTTPLLLLALIGLPILWWLLRAVPPAPIHRRFPGIVLLLGLKDQTAEVDKTPWWLLVLRILALAAAIIGFAGPVLNPPDTAAPGGNGPVVVLMDASWASARDWPARVARVDQILDQAQAQDRVAAVVALTDLPPGGPVLQSAQAVQAQLARFAPAPYRPDYAGVLDWANRIEPGTRLYWMSDGLADPARADLVARLAERANLEIIQGDQPLFALSPAFGQDGQVHVPVHHMGDVETTVDIRAFGRDPVGVLRVLDQQTLTLPAGSGRQIAIFDLPPELRNRITRFEIANHTSAGAVTLSAASLQRRQVALIASQSSGEGQTLLSPLHYLRQALAPSADVIEGDLLTLLLAGPDAVVLADIATLSPDEHAALTDWVENGGVLVRFAGPRLAASDLGRDRADPLIPVRLRAGGRSVGGAMSWGEPRRLRDFDDRSPFAGLTIPADVTVNAQVMAQPGPDLADRTIASLTDGTPLVTRAGLGQGQVVLFHVTANAEWSTLPLSGLFVQMLERLSLAARANDLDIDDVQGTVWVPEQVLDGYGQLQDAGARAGVDGVDLAAMPVSAALLPGVYASTDRRVARNVMGAADGLAPASWPASLSVTGITTDRQVNLAWAFLVAAFVLVLLDALAALGVTGRLARGAMGVALALALMPDGPALAQSDLSAEDLAIYASSDVTLAYVITGDADLDARSLAGLRGLSNILYQRTSVEPVPPVGVDLETADLSLFPMLYWPISPNQALPSAQAYARLNTYMRSGGMIVFDTRDAHLGAFGSNTPESNRLRALAAALDIPPLAPVPQDHVLTRSFYLLQDFPGRHQGRDVWVEASQTPATPNADGMPFRVLNDGVTPVLIGGNDWATAWAQDETGAPVYPVGAGSAGQRQREFAFRFGVNLVMHILSGNYKSDQVHVPALLDRLEQ
jgi:hypothetical protein